MHKTGSRGTSSEASSAWFTSLQTTVIGTVASVRHHSEQMKYSQPAEPASERTDGGWCLTPEELGATSDQSPPFPWMCLAVFNGKRDLISTQGKRWTALSLKTQPAGNFVVPLAPRHGKLLDCRDFSEERLFHRKMLLCWNLKQSTGMCWFECCFCWKPGQYEDCPASEGSWQLASPTRSSQGIKKQ